MKLTNKITLENLVIKKASDMQDDLCFLLYIDLIRQDKLLIKVAIRKNIFNNYETIFATASFRIEKFLNFFPYVSINKSNIYGLLEELKIKKEINPDFVIPLFDYIPNMHLANGKIIKPSITVLEFTEKEIFNNTITYEYPDFDIDLEYELNTEKNVLKKNGENILAKGSADNIYRYNLINFTKEVVHDRLIPRRKLFDFKNFNNRYLFFDTETNGLPVELDGSIKNEYEYPRLVQLAYLLTNENGDILSEGNFLIKPSNFEISQDSTEIHGITNKMANVSGIDIRLVLALFENLVENSTHVIGHNISFDINVIKSELLRLKMTNPFQHQIQVCTMILSTDYCEKGQYQSNKWPKLSELYFKIFEKEYNEGHNAKNDVMATVKCFWELRKRDII